MRDSVASVRLPFAAEPSLVSRLRRGEIAALGETYDLLHAQVRSFARRLVGDDAAAEDLLQETFVALPRAISGYRGDGALRSFVLGVAANQARHHVRAAARRRAAHTRSSEDTAAPDSTPEERMQRRQLAVALANALDELTFEQRVAIVLCEVEERTAAEAAVIVGAPEATVRTRVFHGKRKLREALEKAGIR